MSETNHGLPPGGEQLPIVESTPQERASTIFLSYRFSQGGIGTQNRLLLCIESGYMPNLFAPEGLDEVKVLTHQMVGHTFLDQSLHPATAIPWEYDQPEPFVKTGQLVINELAGLFARFEDRQPLAGFDDSLSGIAASSVVMDADYLARPGGRAGDSTPLKVRVDPYKRDPYDSVFIRCGILGASNTPDIYKDIFTRAATEGVLRALDPITLRQLLFVIDMYTAHHDFPVDARLQATRKLCEELV